MLPLCSLFALVFIFYPRTSMKQASRDSWFPREDLTPVEVVELQLRALQAGDARVYWRFVSPKLKRLIGVKKGYTHNSRFPLLMPPELCKIPVYIPLLGASRFEVVGALATGESSYKVRARAWPAGAERECGGEAQPVEATWRVALQPRVRPACYEDDPMQMGISPGPPFGGCWLADDVRLDERWGGGDDGKERRPSPSDDGGGESERELPAGQRKDPVHAFEPEPRRVAARVRCAAVCGVWATQKSESEESNTVVT